MAIWRRTRFDLTFLFKGMERESPASSLCAPTSLSRSRMRAGSSEADMAEEEAAAAKRRWNCN